MEVGESANMVSPRAAAYFSIIRPSSAEFWGVFLLAFGIHCCGETSLVQFEPLVAVFLFIGIFSFTRPISDAHLNPVITVICILKKRIRPFAGLIYVLAQMSGAVLGALSVKGVTDKKIPGMLKPTNTMDGGNLIFAEMMGTLVVVLAYLTLATKKKGNVAILGIGFGYAGALIAVHSATLGFLNPVLNFGIAVATGEWTKHYVYWVGTTLGGIAAALLHGLVFASPDELWIRPRDFVPERIP